MEKGLEKEFVPYEPSLRLKGIGFDEPCFRASSAKATYHGSSEVKNSKWDSEYRIVAQPTFQCAFDWFREEHGYCSYIKEASKGTYRFYIEKFDEKFFNSDIYNTYGEAKLALLKKLLGYVESKKN